MIRSTLTREQLELDEILATEQKLLKAAKDFDEARKRIAQERIDRENTMPPLDEIELRERRKLHEQIVSRGEAVNVLRAQNQSILLLLLLIVATGTLIWWGLKLMQGS
ncbi:MAG: hypothetical protein H8M99_02860 [Gloeobacteraceae cyanobacterium ES-bin-144]|nr:hypothetical protein [Verrucomicrobiales bacterium]